MLPGCRRTDVVVLTAPAPTRTVGNLDASRLGLLRRQAIVVHVARGPERARDAARLRGLSRTILGPHVGAARRVLGRYRQGERLVNRVDTSAGY
jgi:phosphoglycerate dehydrogenase-like enzyme